MRRCCYKQEQDGFTLIELIVVVAVIGILTAITHGHLANSRERSRDAVRVADISKVSYALDQYYETCRQYPATLTAGAANGCPTGTTFATFAVPDIPEDPTGGTYDYATSGAGAGHDAFVARATLKDENSELATDLDGSLNNGVTLDCDDTPTYYYCVGS